MCTSDNCIDKSVSLLTVRAIVSDIIKLYGEKWSHVIGADEEVY